MATNAELITQLYVSYFGRAPDPSGLNYWVGRIQAGMPVSQIAQSFSVQPEATAKYPYLVNPNVASPSAFVTQVFINLFGHAPDAAGLAYYTGQISAGRPVGNIIVDIVSGAQDTATTKDLTTVNNKVAVGVNFATLAANTPNFQYDANAATTAAAVVGSTTSDPATVTAANTATATYFNSSPVTTTTVLTVGIDSLPGGPGNDLFVGDNSGANKTVSAGDQINGGAGTDTFSFFVDATTSFAGQAMPQLTSVENVLLTGGKLTNGNTADFSGLTGVTNVTLATPAAVMANGETFTIKTTAAQTVGLTAVKGTAAGATSTITLDGATSVVLNGVSTDITLDLKSTAAAATINATGAASTIALTNTGAALATLTLTGDKGISITEALATLKTINASANTGGVTIDASGLGADNDLTFTGGTGADKLTFAAGFLTKTDVLDGGAGTDTLVIKEVAALSAANYAGINAAKNFEVLGLGADGATVDLSLITNGLNQFAVQKGDFGATFQNSLSTSKYTIDNSAGNAQTIVIQNKVGELATSVTIDNQATAVKTLDTLALTGATQIELSSTGKAGNILTTLTNADNSSITVKGAADLTFALSAGTATGSKVDASAFTGKLDVTGSSKADIIIGGTGVDMIKTGGGADTLTGGAGLDKFDVSGSVASGAAIDATITDFAKGETIIFANKGVETFTGAKVDVSTATTIAQALDLASTADGSVNASIKWFQFGGDTYVVNDQTAGATFTAATDYAVKLVGLLDLSTGTVDAAANSFTF